MNLGGKLPNDPNATRSAEAARGSDVDPHSYQRGVDSATEATAWAAVEAAAECLAAVAGPVWGWGDGRGGAVFVAVEKAAERRGLPIRRA